MPRMFIKSKKKIKIVYALYNVVRPFSQRGVGGEQKAMVSHYPMGQGMFNPISSLVLLDINA